MSTIALLTDYHSYYLYCGHTDMRKSFHGLCGIVRNELGKEVNDRDIFIFLNKRFTHIKLLLYETDGFTLFYRRLHRGRFNLSSTAAESGGAIHLNATEVISILSGLHLHRIKKRA